MSTNKEKVDPLIARLHELRKDAKAKSVRALAIMLNVDDSQLSKVFKEQRPITEAIISALEAKLNANREWVLSGIGEKYGQSADSVLPTGNTKRTLSDYVNLLEFYNRTLSNAIIEGLVVVKSNLAQAKKELADQIAMSTSEGLQRLDDISVALKGNNGGSDTLEKN